MERGGIPATEACAIKATVIRIPDRMIRFLRTTIRFSRKSCPDSNRRGEGSKQLYRFFSKRYFSVALGLVLWAGALPVSASANLLAEVLGKSSSVGDLASLIKDANPHCQVPASGDDGPGSTQLAVLYGSASTDLLWRDSDRYEALIAALDELVGDGLDPVLYGTVQLRQWRELPRSEAHLLACRDLFASSAYLTALRHLRYGLLPRESLEPLWRDDEEEEKRHRAAEEAEFNRVAQDGLEDVAAAFQWARPDFIAYSRLRTAFLNWRDSYRFGDWIRLPSGPVLRPGDEDDRVLTLRQRLELVDDLDGEGVESFVLLPVPRYSNELVVAVKNFQRRHGIKVDGVVGPETVAALNVSRDFRQGQLRANLERLRWLARELRPDQLLVDIAGARTVLFRQGEPVWQGRAQVGTADRQTPSLSSRITHLTFNPSWTVPPTIYRQDKLPQIRRDLGYLKKNRLRVLDRAGHELDPTVIDWSSPGAIVLRQDPGPANALGRVAIRFPNPFLVYLHDTPNQKLFDSHQRTFSSGCVRVEGAPALADLLFAGAGRDLLANIGRVRESGETRNIHLPEPLPILMEYWTAAADETGEVIFRPDIYRRDRALVNALREREESWRQALAARRY